MAAQPLPGLPAPGTPPPEPADDTDLDTRISLVEMRLIAREERLHGRLQQMGQRLGQAAAPRALLLKLAGVALAGGVLVWAIRSGGVHAAARSVQAAAGGSPPHLLLSLLPMAWPLLPARWRTRISPATAATVLGLAAPVVQSLLARRAAGVTSSAPPTMAHVDLLRYAGTWHEQARLPAPFEGACAGQPRAVYTPQGSRLAVRNECRAASGRLRVAEGVARVVPGSGGARLQVSFMPTWLQWLPFVWADLWILHVDESAADYRVAIAGHPSRQGLWLLSRSPQLPDDQLQRLIAVAKDLGYDTDRLVLASPPDTPH